MNLTKREREVAELFRMSNKEIGRTLGIALNTVKAHFHSIFVKLEISRRSDLEKITFMNCDESSLEAKVNEVSDIEKLATAETGSFGYTGRTLKVANRDDIMRGFLG